MEFTIERTLEILSSTPSVLKSLLSGLSDEWIELGTPEAWGPNEILGHLIHCEEADWMVRSRSILDYGEGQAFEPLDRLAQFENSKGRTLTELLSGFATLRHENLEELNSWHLTADQLDLTGTHPEFGSVTLRQLLATWAVHDLTHIRQLVTVLAKQYDAEVGPWRQYLSILK